MFLTALLTVAQNVLKFDTPVKQIKVLCAALPIKMIF